MTSRLIRVLRPRRRVGWLWVAMTVATLVNGLRLRGRLRALERVPGPGDADRDSAPIDPEHLFVTAEGVHLDEGTRRRASRYAARHRLDVLDLVPGNLATEQTLDLVRLVDPATYASNRLAPGRGPGQATLVHRDVLIRAGWAGPVEDLDPVRYLDLTAQLKRFAAKSIDLALVEDLDGMPEDPAKRRACLSALYSKAAPAVIAVPGAHSLLLGAGLYLAPGWAVAAAISYCVQPYLAVSGTGVRPGDLTPAGALARPARRGGPHRPNHPRWMDPAGNRLTRRGGRGAARRVRRRPGRWHRPVLRTPPHHLSAL